MRHAARRLAVVADDFGRTPGVNPAIASASEDGIVTGASLMVGAEAFDEAVRLRESPAPGGGAAAPEPAAARGFLLGSGVAQHLRHPLQQLPADDAIRFDERAE